MKAAHFVFLVFLFYGWMMEPCVAQKVLILEKIGSHKRFFYSVGDPIKLQTFTLDYKIHSDIIALFDSSMVLENRLKINFQDVKCVSREIHGLKLVQNLSLIAGIGFLVIDIINNTLNNKQVIQPATLLISGSLIGTGLVMIPLKVRNYHTRNRWRMKVLDYSSF